MVVVVVLASLSASAVAYAAEAEVSYIPPAGESATTTGGTSTFQGATSVEGFVTLSLYEGSAGTLGSLKCDPNNLKLQCDVYTSQERFTAKPKPKAPCGELSATVIVCPDADNFVANLGGGAENEYKIDAPLEYDTAIVNGGAGNDKIIGADPPETEGFPDRDIFNGGGGSDQLSGGPGEDELRGGPGDDGLDGGGGNDRLFGEAGNDELIGGAGNDLENGGEGTDLLGETTYPTPDAGQLDGGADTFEGGGGSSTVTYSRYQGPVSVSLDGVANDGEAGEDDNVEPGVAVVVGTSAGDTLIAGAAPVTLIGEGGNDTIDGGPGGDTLIGEAGNDTINTVGPAGVGPDSIYGDITNCNAFGCAAGNDTINADDGIQDQINCGPGADIVNADFLDVIATDPINGCELINRSAAPPKPPPPGPSVPGNLQNVAASLLLSLSKPPSHGVRGFLKSGLTATASCPASCSLSAQATISHAIAKRAHLASAKAVVIGSGHATLLKAGSAKIKINLTAKARRALKHLAKFAVTVQVTSKNAGGSITTASKSVTI